MQADWKAALAAMHKDVLHGEAPWRPLRQSTAVAETVEGRWWKLALATLPVALFLGLLWQASRPAEPLRTAQAERIEVVFLSKPESRTEAVPPPPSPPALRRQRSLLAVPIPEPPRAVDIESLPATAAETSRIEPLPSGGDLLRQIGSSVRRQTEADEPPIATRTRPRLPGRAEAFVEGIHVRGRPSPEQRVQFVLGLVGLGQQDPCPDIRSHVQSAIDAMHRGRGVDGELEFWLTHAEKCRR